MDANGLRFHLLADAAHWRLEGAPPGLVYDRERRTLRLARQRRELRLREDPAEAGRRLQSLPLIRDGQGNLAWYERDWRRILVADRECPEVAPRPLFRVPGEGAVSDLVVGHDGVLYIAVGGAIFMHDLRERWHDVEIRAEGIEAWRLAPAAGGGVWVLDRRHRQLARLRGQPLSERARVPHPRRGLPPCEENPDPPCLRPLEGVTWPDDETPVALSSDTDGRLACLSWRGTGGEAGEGAALRLLEDERLGEPMLLRASHRPYSLAWMDAARIAVLVCGEFRERDDAPPEARSEARVYALDTGDAPYPEGDLYPLKPGYAQGPFVHGFDRPPHYPVFRGSEAFDSRPLQRLSFPFYARRGEARDHGERRPLDAGEAGTVWHRLYLEASVPAGCGVRIWLAASDRANASAGDLAWFEHRLGEAPATAGGETPPSACWLPQASELPHHRGLLPCVREPGRKGLFTVLIQRTGRRVRRLRGRYLHVRVSLHGPGNATPELYALRAWAGRFSYLENYLPELYHEQVFAPEADDAGEATGADFLERYLGIAEGVLTTLEDRIACADLLTRPQSVPADSLEWLAGWVGLDCEPGWTETQRRRFLAASGDLQRWHGTLRGLSLALDIVSHGGVTRGEIVVLEDFRLRRTFATILGADLDDHDDPLTLGGMVSGNSFVGDTLFLGDDQVKQEFLALFGADLDLDPGEADTVAAFFDGLAFRVTLLVRVPPGAQVLEAERLGELQRIAERQVPAHVQWRILPASEPLLVGLRSLVGVDTWLAEHPLPGAATVGQSRVGRGDYVSGRASLVPGSATEPPQARGRDAQAPFGESFLLDGSESRAAEGRRLVAWRWSWPGAGPGETDEDT